MYKNILIFSDSVSPEWVVKTYQFGSHKNIIYPSILITYRDYLVYLVTVFWCQPTGVLSAGHLQGKYQLWNFQFPHYARSQNRALSEWI